MRSRFKKSRFTITKTINDEPMTIEEWDASEKFLARLVAEAYAADHPELFTPANRTGTGVDDSLDRTYTSEGGPNEELQ